MKISNDGIVPPWLQPIDLWPLPTNPDYPHLEPTAFIPDDRYDGFTEEGDTYADNEE